LQEIILSTKNTKKILNKLYLLETPSSAEGSIQETSTLFWVNKDTFHEIPDPVGRLRFVHTEQNSHVLAMHQYGRLTEGSLPSWAH
jgi:hypothetical protein